MKTTWVYLCSDLKRLDLTLFTLGWKQKPIVLVHRQDQAFIRAVIKRGCQISIMDTPVRKAVELVDSQAFYDYCYHPKPGWALGCKMVIPLMFRALMRFSAGGRDNLLYTDDDVLVTRDPSYLGTGWCTAHEFDKLGEGQWDYDFCNALGHIFFEHDEIFPWEYNKHAIDFGIWSIPDANDWLKYLRAYWSLPSVCDVLHHQNRFRLNDQRFAAFYFWYRGWQRIKSTQHRRMVMHTFEKWDKRVDLCKKSTFVHYGCGKHKSSVQEYLEEHWND